MFLEIHYDQGHPGCNTPCPICCFAAYILISQCWCLVVVTFSVFEVQSDFLCIAGSFATLDHS